jgi:hypothetical protein
MTKQRLTKSKIKELYAQYYREFNGDKKAIAYELAKDFIFDAGEEFEKYIKAHPKKFGEIENPSNLWVQAIEETREFIH